MSSTNFSNEPIKDFPIPPMVDALIESTKRRGPMVLEVWTCRKCKCEAWCFHHFSETIQCGYCGHSTDSKVPLYKSIKEAAADEG